METKLNGFNNGIDASDGVGGRNIFDEMREAGSNIPDKVKYLQEHGWQSYKHHDNWVRRDLKDVEKDLCNFDLNSAYKECLRENNELPDAIRVLCKNLKGDPGYYISWQANIAMSMFDEMKDNGHIKQLSEGVLLQMCNDGAKNFLNLLINK